MQLTLSLLAGILFALEASAKPVAGSSYAVKDSHVVPPGWRKLADAPANHIINLQIGLKQGKFDELENHLLEVSDPSHHRYGQYLSHDEVNDLIKPNERTLESVQKWLSQYGISSDKLSFNEPQDWITVPLTVATIEKLLQTKYSIYENERDGDRLIRTSEWSLPKSLIEDIITIQPTNSFFRPMTKKMRHMPVKTGTKAEILDTNNAKTVIPAKKGQTVADVCDTNAVTPLCLRTLYGTVKYIAKSAGKNKMALNDFLGEVNNRSDAEIYLKLFRPEAVNAAHQFEQVSIAGGTTQQTPLNASQLDDGTGIEGALDVQTMLGIGWPTPLKIWSTGGSNPTWIPDAVTTTNSDEPYLVWLQTILKDRQIPQVISTSYGDDEQTISRSYAQHTCNLFAQLGARGVTVLFASGDSGVGAAKELCITNDGKNTTTFLPSFPPTCPYVTAVGATYKFNPEVAAFDGRFKTPFTSGGGFSNYFGQPKWQKKVVDAYLKKTVGSQYKGLYNPRGRAYPDIAAQGVNLSTVYAGKTIGVDGTSASTPTISAVLALVNDALITAGRPTLGFMNQWLYQKGYKGFNDILSGSAAGCGVTGFEAAVGWDGVTGFGTPNFPKIVKELGLKNCGV